MDIVKSQEMARQDEMTSKVSVLLTFCQGVRDDGRKDKLFQVENHFTAVYLTKRSHQPPFASLPNSAGRVEKSRLKVFFQTIFDKLRRKSSKFHLENEEKRNPLVK